jgi:hypothetical protein
MKAEDLLDEIDDLFGGLALHAESSRRVEDLYEGFLLGLVLEAARRIDPAAVSWHKADGTVATEVWLRGGPGEIYSARFTHAKLTFSGVAIYECHAAANVVGMRAVHECDVLVLHAGVGTVRRLGSQRPKYTDSLFALEGKAYVRSAVDIKLARQVVGTCVDLSHQRLGLVAAKAIDASAVDLVGGWSPIGAWGPVRPGTSAADALVDRLELLLRV